MSTFSIESKARSFPTFPYEKMKDDILGKSYELSLTFVGSVTAQKLNKTYRNKTYVPNVLSFPLDPKTGEIFIAPVKARTEAKAFGMSEKGYIGFLFIHALLHLKGLDHGDTMDKAEKKYCIKYGLR
jgi:probable rRNA maturation factor